MNEKWNILVVGASGTLGGMICKALSITFNDNLNLFTSDYKIQRGKKTASRFKAQFCRTDVTDEKSLKPVLKEMDIVVVAVRQQHPFIQTICMEYGVICIDVTVFHDLTAEVERFSGTLLKTSPALVMMSGFFPGLSGLLLKKSIEDFDRVSEANIILIQSTNAKAGASGIMDMLTILSKPVETCIDEQKKTVPGFSLKRNIMLPRLKERYQPRLIRHCEKKMVSERLKIDNINYFTCWDKPAFNTLVAFLKHTGAVDFIVRKVRKKWLSKLIRHNPEKPEKTTLAVQVKGSIDNIRHTRTNVIRAFSDYETTAMVTAAMAQIVVKKKITGMVYPFEIAGLDEVLSLTGDKRIEFYRSPPLPEGHDTPLSTAHHNF